MTAGLVLLAGTAAASTARVVPFDEKVAVADAIVLGRVTATESQWDPQKRWIVTRTTFAVDRAIKGAPSQSLTIVTPGGTVDGIRQETSGVPSFRKGDEQIVFVKQAEAGATVAFFDQGVYAVSRNASGEPVVEAAPSRLLLVDQTGRAAAGDPAGPLTLARFEQAVRQSAARSAPGATTMAMKQQEPEESDQPRGFASTLREFASDHWKILTLVGFGVLLALIPLIRRR
ncbi:MAG TPA: hypothetical protein VM557_08055 [Thermoanaerobaculia bacterium]|nr:hypothetical protein [Thermoanaerobaculia bacterium]